MEDYANEKFEKGNDSYDVCYFVEDKCVIDEENVWKLVFSPKKGVRKFDYLKKGTIKSERKDPPTAIAKVSFILAFKFNKDDVFLKEWGRLNYLRNEVAVHGGQNNININIDDLKSLIEIVELFLINQ